MKAQAYFGATLRRLRTERNKSQEELAAKAGISVQYLRGLEGGRYNPTLNVLFDIGSGLGVHPADLLRDVPLDAETRNKEGKRPGPPEGAARRTK